MEERDRLQVQCPSEERNEGISGQQDFSTLRGWVTLANHDPRLGLSMLALIPAGMLLFIPLCLLPQFWPFLLEGRWASGTVVGREPLAAIVRPQVQLAGVLAHGGGHRDGPTYRINYQFRDPQGAVQRGSAAVGWEIWNRLKPGDPVDVLYTASNPHHHQLWLAARRELKPAAVMTSIACVLLSISCWMMVRGLRGLAGDVRLLREGEATSGTVTRVERQGKSGRDALQNVTFTYEARTSLAGPVETLSGRSTGSMKGGSLQPGDRVRVVYDPLSPESCILDWHGLRTGGVELGPRQRTDSPS